MKENAEVEKPLEELFMEMVLVGLIRSVYKGVVDGRKVDRYFYLVVVEGFLEEKRKK
ncbi:hypothetical protein [Bacillus alkalisoli]|uniref:hypothetical protein n=1 Tax=Bacillus alkalisoli TaxID=2011008 RepID=UPI0012FF32FC|nr:hypothetical protein [Bacillus alkalisoli]